MPVALIEALMGFQFNHVGGGTKTRRPVAIEMVYDVNAESPECFLATPDGDQKMTLDELKGYIESENVRLGAEGRFDATDIIVQIRYKHCPNLMIIDTPGATQTGHAFRKCRCTATIGYWCLCHVS